MSYDLEFCVAAGTPPPSADDLLGYFRPRPWYRIQGSRAFYGNEDTGVYFWFETGERDPGEPPAADQAQDGLRPAGVSFTINYVRPGIFALEAERELRAVVERFGLSVDDPQINGMGRGSYSSEGFLSGWRTGNDVGYRAVAEQMRADPEGEPIPTLPSAEMERCWRWNLQRNDLQASLGPDVFVPRISFASRESRIQSFVVWGDAMPVALPEVDLLLLVRQQLAPRRLLFFRRRDMSIATFDELGPLLGAARREVSPLPHHLFVFDRPPDQLVRFFSERSPATAGVAGVTVDKILDAELLEQALSAPPLQTLSLDGGEDLQ